MESGSVMADQIYKVQDPQGNIRQISGPAGASEAEIIAQAQKLFQTAPATPAPEIAPPQISTPKRQVPDLMSMLPPKEESPLSGLYMGATDPFYAGGRLAMETGIGDKQAMDKAIAEREAQYQAGRQNKGFDTSRLAGNIISPPNIALTMALPESLVSTVPRLLATGSVLGAGTSLLNPVTEPAQQKDYGETLKSNMMMGGMLGPVFQGGAKAAGAVGGNIAQRVSESSAAEAAKLKLAEVLSKSGVGSLFEPGGAGNALSQIEAKLSKLGPEATLVDASGQPTKTLLDTLATLPGQTKTLVEQLIRNRQATRPERIMTAADEALGTGGAGYKTTLDALVKQKQTEAAPLYKQIENLSIKVDPELNKLLQAAPKAHGGYEELSQLNRQTPIDLSKIKPGDDIPFDALDKVKQALYDLADKSKGEFGKPTNLSRSYDQLRIDLTNKMDKLSPKDPTTNESIYKMARDAFAGPSQLEGAVKAGRTAMKTDEIGVSELTKGMSASELDAFRVGALQSLRDKVGTEAGQTSLLKMWKEPATSGKLKEIFGTDYRQFAASVAKEARLKEIEQTGRGTKTAQRLLAAGELDTGDVMQAGQAVASASQGNAAPLINTVMNLGKKISTPEQTRNEMAKLLLEKGPFAMRTLRELPLAVKQFNEAQARNAALANTLAQQPNR
jgi:hypothetical protein